MDRLLNRSDDQNTYPGSMSTLQNLFEGDRETWNQIHPELNFIVRTVAGSTLNRIWRAKLTNFEHALDEIAADCAKDWVANIVPACYHLFPTRAEDHDALECLRAMVRTNAKFRTIDYLRKQSIQHQRFLSTDIDFAFEHEAINPSEAERRYQMLIQRLLALLKEKDHPLFMLRYVDGLSYKAIAEKQKISMGTALSAGARIRQKLQSKQRFLDLDF